MIPDDDEDEKNETKRTTNDERRTTNERCVKAFVSIGLIQATSGVRRGRRVVCV